MSDPPAEISTNDDAPLGVEPERDILGKPAPNGSWAHRRGEPRVFAFGWTAILLLATAATLFASGLGWVFSDEAFRANAQRLMLVLVLATTVLWPMLRLSQARPACGGPRAVIGDLPVVLIPMQAVIWPQALPPAAWPASVTAAVALTLAAWACIVGALLAAALGPGRAGASAREAVAPKDDLRPGARTLWMAVTIGVATLGMAPALTLAPTGPDAPPTRPLWLLSPFTGVYELTRDRSWTGQHTMVTPAHWRAVGMTWAAAGGLGLLAAGWSEARRRGVAPGLAQSGKGA